MKKIQKKERMMKHKGIRSVRNPILYTPFGVK